MIIHQQVGALSKHSHMFDPAEIISHSIQQPEELRRRMRQKQTKIQAKVGFFCFRKCVNLGQTI